MAEEKVIMQEEGKIKISEEVVELLSEKAIKELEGVSGLAAGFLKGVFGKKTGANGVDVDIKDGSAAITMHVVIKYGCRIPEVAWRIQEAVKNTVESMTGLNIACVNVNVDGVKFPEEEVEQPAEAAEEE